MHFVTLILHFLTLFAFYYIKKSPAQDRADDFYIIK